MPDLKHVAIRNLTQLKNTNRYFKNSKARSHGEKIKLDEVRSIGPAPAKNFPRYVDKGRKRVKNAKRGRGGRPLSFGEWFMMTFPDWSDLKLKEKTYYELKMISALDDGATGIFCWHDKLLFDTHDFNLVAAPFYDLNGSLGPLRDLDHSVLQRLKRTSDQATERINRRRAALGFALIPTMPQVQTARRAAAGGKSLAELLAGVDGIERILCPPPGQAGDRKTLRKAVIRVLKNTGCKIKAEDWQPNWMVRIQLPGRAQPQRFSMVMILNETLQLILERDLSSPPKTKPAAARPPEAFDGPTNPARPVLPPPTPTPAPPLPAAPVRTTVAAARPTPVDAHPPKAPPALTLTRVLDLLLLQSRARRRRLLDEEDLRKRLALAGLTCQTTKAGRFDITDAHGQCLTVETDRFVVACQRRLVQETLYAAANVPGLPAARLDLEEFNAWSEKTALWKVPLYGEFWEILEDLVDDATLSEAWQTTVRATANVNPMTKRVQWLEGWLREDKVGAWKIAALLQLHCGGSPTLGGCVLTSKVEATPEFEFLKKHLVATGYEPPRHLVHLPSPRTRSR